MVSLFKKSDNNKPQTSKSQSVADLASAENNDMQDTNTDDVTPRKNTQSQVVKQKNATKTTKPSGDKAKKKKEKEKIVGKTGRELSARLIVEPWVTEKSHAEGEKFGKYMFVVRRNATRLGIKQAVEELYGVQVTGVNIKVYKPRKKNFGRIQGMTSGKKVAIVTLKEGDSIDLYKHV